jgi:hypothetical protein
MMNIKRLKAKPVEIKGIIWDGTNLDEIKKFCNGLAHFTNGYLYIETTEGTSRATVGDWILCGTEGEFYPCRSRVVENKYTVKEELSND